MVWPKRPPGPDEVVLSVVVGFLFSLLVFVPLSGVLVRWRVHHKPRRIQLEPEEEGVSPNRVSDVGGYLSTLRRVYAVEGVSGYYKGLLPDILRRLSSTAITIVTIAYLVDWPRRVEWTIGLALRIALIITLDLVIDIPLQILTTRAIVTPYKLPWTQLRTTLKILLSSTERRRPWTLYLLPGIFINHLIAKSVCMLVMAVHMSFAGAIEYLILGKMAPVLLTCHLILASFWSVWMVAQARLAVQRTLGSKEEDESAIATNLGVQPYSTEDVIK
ncbi:hypothetical protein PQX77_006023 [Marasmius sp. AFHP31]|nr:hypothetical protein PQX77_006023 [Marasmius sp. AFHP31]